MDLDHFKQINDTHGHDVGDDVLIALARTFGSLRSADVPVRWGGEEFLILCPATTVDHARQVIDRMREGGASTVQVAGKPVTFSAGVAPLEAAEDLDLAVSAADAAMYRAKQNGRNRVE